MQPEQHKPGALHVDLTHSVPAPSDAALASQQSTIISLMKDYGSVTCSGFGLLAVDPISNQRIPLRGISCIHPALREFLKEEKTPDFDNALTPVAAGIVRLALEDLAPQLRQLLGDYPVGLRVQVFSERDSEDFQLNSTPVLLSFAFSRNLKADSSPDLRHEYMTLLEKSFKPLIFVRFGELYQQHIAPLLPDTMKSSPFFGGVAFGCQWEDHWNNPCIMTPRTVNPFRDVPRDVRIDPYEVPRTINQQVLARHGIKVDAICRKLFYGEFFPHMIEAGIGMPSSVRLTTVCPVIPDAAISTRLEFGFAAKPDKPDAFIEHYDREFIQGAFSRRLSTELELLCREQIFPEIASLPAPVPQKFTGLQFSIEHQLD